MTLPTAAQIGAVLEAAHEAFRPFVALCAFAGLRLGEAAGLRVEDIDFLRRTLNVARQVQRAGRGHGRAEAAQVPQRAGGVSGARAGGDAGGAGRHALPGRRVALQRLRIGTAAPEHRRPPLARGDRGCERTEFPSSRPPALLRIRSHRVGLRRRHRPAGPRPRVSDHHVVDLLAPVAERRGPHPSRRAGLARGIVWTGCGLEHHGRPLACGFIPDYTLKRNSTTSPSAMT
jgi:hypothetical protein